MKPFNLLFFLLYLILFLSELLLLLVELMEEDFGAGIESVSDLLGRIEFAIVQHMQTSKFHVPQPSSSRHTPQSP